MLLILKGSYRRNIKTPIHLNEAIYLCGHSLGLQPKSLKEDVGKELEKWAEHGVEGHFLRGSKNTEPWVSYDHTPLEYLGEIVGAKPEEVVAMNSLTANLHFLMNCFYRPTEKRFKILVEDHLFPSDFIACKTQIESHGYDVEDALVIAKPKPGSETLTTEDILSTIENHRDSLCIVLIGGVQYLTGQFFQIQAISNALKDTDIFLGVDLAHAVGNVELYLHDWGVDFGCWCSYKYMNSGPGGIGGAFVHEKNLGMLKHKRERKGFLGGWWSHREEDRFEMKHELVPANSALAWQVSNPPILLLAALNSSLKLFHKVGMKALRKKSESLTCYLEFLIQKKLSKEIEIVTPGFERKEERGAMLCLRLKRIDEIDNFYKTLENEGVIGDVRRPDIIRVAPCPLYNTFKDIYDFVAILAFSLESFNKL